MNSYRKVKYVCLFYQTTIRSNQGTDGFNLYPMDLVMRINALASAHRLGFEPGAFLVRDHCSTTKPSCLPICYGHNPTNVIVA